jgi:RimJ/RimL family protein N-acetyltransferase
MTVPVDSRLADGRQVILRLAGPADVAAITGLYLELSADSFRSRFRSTRPAAAVVSGFAALGAATTCIVAVLPGQTGRLVGEARYVPVDAETAEIALTVRDDHQGTGLGRLLLAALMRTARENGLSRVRAEVLLGNVPMVRLMQRYGCAVTDYAAGYSEANLEISTTGGMPGWPRARTGRRVLVEQRGWFDTPAVAALRAAGSDIRLCTGPKSHGGRDCALVSTGECRLAAEADQIVCLLPASDPDCAAVLAAHQRHWPRLLSSP